MSSFLSELGGITAGVGAEGLAFAAGFAASHALTPEATLIGQDAWHAAQLRRLDAMIAAQAAAEALASEGAMADEASYSGIDASRFEYLYRLSLTAPGMGELLTMLRRGTINSGNFTHGLRKAKLEPMWDAALAELVNQYVGLGDIAVGIVRGALPAPSYVPVPPPTGGTTVPRFPQVNIDPEALAKKLGYSPEMLQLMVARSGLSLAPGLSAQAFFRKLINHNDYELAIAEGDLRTEWAQTLLDVSRAILTPHEYVEAHLRGWVGPQAMYDGTARHGMSTADTDLLFDISGRPTSIRQVYVGLARGATFPSAYADVPSPFREALQQSNIRPEWASIAYENRFSLPSAFVVRALLTDGAITAQRGQTILEHSGWPPDLAQIVAEHYAGGTVAGADPHVVKAQTQLWTTTHRSYVGHETTDADATTALSAAGVAAASVPAVLTLWQHERDLIRKQLTPTQLKKAYAEAVLNPATGAAWTHDEAVARLVGMGYSVADATTFLEL